MSTEITIPKAGPLRVPQRPQGEMFELMLYWRSIAKRKWIILGIAFATAVVAAIASLMMTPVYRATATVLIEQNRSRVVSVEEVYSGVNSSREHFETQADILASRALAAKVIDKLNLSAHPEFDPRQGRPSLWQRTLRSAGIGSEPQLTEKKIRTMVQDAFAKRTIVDPGRMSQVIRVSFDAHDPELAATVANTLVDTYIQEDVDTRSRVTKRAGTWLDERLVGLKKNLEESERELQAYRERQNIIETRGLAQSGAVRQIEDLTRALVEARQRRTEVESAYNQMRSANDNVETLPVVQRSPLMARLKELEGDAERRYAELSRRYGPRHPRLIQAESELKQARENTRRQVQTLAATLGNEYETARANERAIERSMAEAKGQVQGLNRKEFQLGALERAVNTNRQLYDTFLSRSKETSAGSGVPSGGIARITDPAIPPEQAVKPKKTQIVAITFTLALFFAMFGAVLLERLDNTIKSVDDIEEKLGESMLAMLPMLRGDAARYVGTHLLQDPTSAFSEGIRTARTGVSLSSLNVPRKILLITSAISNEGKTAVALNLALAHAQTQRVLLIDADMRKPAVGAALGLDQRAPGLSELVAGTASLKDCVQRMEDSPLEVITCGAVAPDPLQLMLTPRFQQMVTALAEGWDVVVIDSPPIHLVSDAAVLGTLATGVVFVIKADSTPYRIAQRSIEALKSVGARLFGIVLNQLDFAKADRYYGAYTGSGDGYYTAPRSSVSRKAKPALRRVPPAVVSSAERNSRIAGNADAPPPQAETHPKPGNPLDIATDVPPVKPVDRTEERPEPQVTAAEPARTPKHTPAPVSEPSSAIGHAELPQPLKAAPPTPAAAFRGPAPPVRPQSEPEITTTSNTNELRQLLAARESEPRPSEAPAVAPSSKAARTEHGNEGVAAAVHPEQARPDAEPDPLADIWERHGWHKDRKAVSRSSAEGGALLRRIRSLWA